MPALGQADVESRRGAGPSAVRIPAAQQSTPLSAKCNNQARTLTTEGGTTTSGEVNCAAVSV